MTQEQKAKAYDEALEKARKYRDEEGFTEMEDLFPELAESEDEKMINGLQGFLSAYGSDYFGTDGWQKFDDWLERQKEPRDYRKLYKGVSQSDWFKENYKGKSLGEEQPTEIPKEPHYTKRNELFDKCVKNCDPKVMKEVSDKIDEMLQKEQKPAENSGKELLYVSSKSYNIGYRDGKREAEQKQEWSEEDENTIQEIIGCIEQARADSHLSEDHCLRLETFLYKHYRPSWKPSEEQMEALKSKLPIIKGTGNNVDSILESLYEQLKQYQHG